MKRTRIEKGITLIALIITIIILLILAVVAIGAVRESGIIGHAQNSADRYNTEKAQEESMLGQYEDTISQYETEGSSGTNGEQPGDDITEGEGNTIPTRSDVDILKELYLNKNVNELLDMENFNSEEGWYPAANNPELHVYATSGHTSIMIYNGKKYTNLVDLQGNLIDIINTPTEKASQINNDKVLTNFHEFIYVTDEKI